MIFEMEAEEQRLFSNPAFAASIFLNPSFKHNLKQNSDSQVLVKKTIRYLSNLMKRMETLENRKKESGKNDINAEGNCSCSNLSQVQFLKGTCASHHSTNPASETFPSYR